MKKLLLLFGLMLMLCLLTGYGAAETSGVTGGLYWVANDTISAVVGFVPGITNVTVPSRLGGKPVQLIAAQAFLGCTTLKSITFPEGMLAIGQEAFKDCTALTTVSFPGTLVLLADYAFYNCGKLEKALLPDSVIALGDYAFGKCSSLSELQLSPFTEYIGAWCFYACVKISDVTFTENLQFIGEHGFAGCGLTRIWLPDSLENIENAAFMSCTKATEVHLGSAVKRIGTSAFDSMAATSIDLPESLETIDDYAFSKSKLTEIVIPPSVTTLGIGVFSECKSLVNVDIRAAITKIPMWTFSLCTSLTQFQIPDSVTAIGQEAFASSGLSGAYVIPDTVTKIETRAFYSTKLTEITFPALLKELPDYVLENCGSLKEVHFGPKIKKFGNYVFQRSGLETFVIPNSVTEIGTGTFCNTNIRSVTLSSRMTSIPPQTFTNCSQLKEFTIPPQITLIDRDAFAFSGLVSITIPDTVQTVFMGAFRSCTDLEEVIIGDSTECYSECFGGCTALRHFHIPACMTSIPSNMFTGCTALEDMDIPENITVIGMAAFSGCSQFRGMKLPSGLTKILNGAFRGTGLESITLPASCRTVENDVFYKCDALKDVYVLGEDTYFYDHAFSYGVSDVTLHVFPGSTAQAFADEAGMNYVLMQGMLILPSSVTVIESGAFAGVDAESVKIPFGVTQIAPDAFEADMILIVEPGSYAEAWAREHGFAWRN
ncbi:MAG: leucine-rich repeat domain-containing protein [Clostridia bacterium]|nr:leucine-rich repeat domain-containing protein [Clostridia bacterium]